MCSSQLCSVILSDNTFSFLKNVIKAIVSEYTIMAIPILLFETNWPFLFHQWVNLNVSKCFLYCLSSASRHFLALTFPLPFPYTSLPLHFCSKIWLAVMRVWIPWDVREKELSPSFFLFRQIFILLKYIIGNYSTFSAVNTTSFFVESEM